MDLRQSPRTGLATARSGDLTAAEYVCVNTVTTERSPACQSTGSPVDTSNSDYAHAWHGLEVVPKILSTTVVSGAVMLGFRRKPSGSGDDKFESQSLNLILVVAAALLLVAGVVAALLTDIKRLPPSWDSFSKSIGASLIAAVLTYIVVSSFVEPRQTSLMTKRVAREGIDYTIGMFQSLFKLSLPTATFEQSDGLKPAFTAAFIKLISNSTRYEIKGTTAQFAAFRLSKLQRVPAVRNLVDVNLILLDPQYDELLKANAQVKLDSGGATYDNAMLEAEASDLKAAIFCTILTMFEIRKTRPSRVYLHRDLPYFRSEHFDNGLLLSYYVGESPYHETLQFAPETRQYVVYKQAKDLSIKFAHGLLRFGEHDGIDSEEHLTVELRNLGCTYSIEALREMILKRNLSLEEQLQAAKISDETF